MFGDSHIWSSGMVEVCICHQKKKEPSKKKKIKSNLYMRISMFGVDVFEYSYYYQLASSSVYSSYQCFHFNHSEGVLLILPFSISLCSSHTVCVRFFQISKFRFCPILWGRSLRDWCFQFCTICQALIYFLAQCAFVCVQLVESFINLAGSFIDGSFRIRQRFKTVHGLKCKSVHTLNKFVIENVLFFLVLFCDFHQHHYP